MKILAAGLFCFVLFAAECMAIKGGPNYGGNNVVTTGTYAGVLYPVTTVNSIGLFSVQIPRTGLGTGNVFLFANSHAYTGTMQATADPDSRVFTGFIDAGFPFIEAIPTGTDDDGNPTFTVVTVRAVAAGRVDGRVKANRDSFGRSAARLTGFSLIEFTPGLDNPSGIFYQLVGFKQADL